MLSRTLLLSGLVPGLLLGAALWADGRVRSADAIEIPPPPPTTYHGAVPEATPGKKVIAIVLNGGAGTACGDGLVLNDAFAGIVYVADVISNTQKAGCGLAGRQIRFYFPADGRFSAATAAWQEPGLRRIDLTFGSQLLKRGVAPQVVRESP